MRWSSATIRRVKALAIAVILGLAGAGAAQAGSVRLAFRSGGRWHRATGVVERRGAIARLATEDPRGRRLALSLGVGRRAAVVVHVRGAGPSVDALRIGFRARR